jgi:hypothetical protein
MDRNLLKQSRITEEFPDKEQYPLYYEAKRYEFILNEGEMLYIPAGWWHFVFSEEPNKDTGVNFAFSCWHDPKEGFPCVQKHNIPKINLEHVFGNDILEVYVSEEKYFPLLSIVKKEAITYTDFLKIKNPNHYIIQSKYREKLIRYAPNIGETITGMTAFVNFGDVRKTLHFDYVNNWLCQIQGRKRAILFPPGERDKLYPMVNNI